MSLRSLSRNLATNTRSRNLECGEDNEMGESVVRVGTRLVLRLATGVGNLWVASAEGREMGCLELRVSMIMHKYAYMLQAQWNRQISRMEIHNAIYTLAKERNCIKLFRRSYYHASRAWRRRHVARYAKSSLLSTWPRRAHRLLDLEHFVAAISRLWVQLF
jgi:hypothetical protein